MNRTISGAGYGNKSISHSINITLGDGQASITANGEEYSSNLHSGELEDN